MFLFSRWKEIFSKDFWKKSKFMSLNSSVGFFAFWNFLFVILITVVSVLGLSMLTSEGIDDFRRDFVDFEVKLEDGILSTENLPDPFVFSEFMASENSGQEFGIDSEIIDSFKDGFREGFNNENVKINGREFTVEDLEFVLDTEGVLGLNESVIPTDKIGVYLFDDRYVAVDPSAVDEEERFEIEMYADSEMEDFTFDKEFLITEWDKVSGKVFTFFGFVLFGFLFVTLVLVRLVTTLVWAALIMLFGKVFKFEWTYIEAYGVGLNYFVPVTLLEMLIVLGISWVPFMTVSLLLLFMIAHGSMMEKQEIDKPEVLEG
jgi:hypothetical protein